MRKRIRFGTWERCRWWDFARLLGLACGAYAAAVLQVDQCEMLTLLRAIFHVIQPITLSCSSRNPGGLVPYSMWYNFQITVPLITMYTQRPLLIVEILWFMFVISKHMTCVSTHGPKISLQYADWEIFLDGLHNCLEVGCGFNSCSMLNLHCANALKLSVSAAEVKGRFVFEGVVILSLIFCRRVLIPQEAEETQRVVYFLGYIIIGQGKIHVCSTYTCVSGSAQCSTEVWTVRKMLDRKT